MDCSDDHSLLFLEPSNLTSLQLRWTPAGRKNLRKIQSPVDSLLPPRGKLEKSYTGRQRAKGFWPHLSTLIWLSRDMSLGFILVLNSYLLTVCFTLGGNRNPFDCENHGICYLITDLPVAIPSLHLPFCLEVCLPLRPTPVSWPC